VFATVEISRQLPLEFMTHGAEFFQIFGSIVAVITIFVIHFGHALGPFGNPAPLDQAIKSQMAIPIAALPGLERRHARPMRPFAITCRLTMTAMNSPSLGTIFIFVLISYWSPATVIDADGAKLQYLTHVTS